MLQAKDIMATDVVTASAETTIEVAIGLVKDVPFSGLPVVDGDGKAVGLVSQNDLFRGLAFVISTGDLPEAFQSAKRKASVQLLTPPADSQQVALKQFLARPVSDVMTTGVHTCQPETPLAEVCELMTNERIHRAVVVDGAGRVTGLISATDLVRQFGEHLQGAG